MLSRRISDMVDTVIDCKEEPYRQILASKVDIFLKESENNVELGDMLKIKEVNSFQELFEVVKSPKERDIVLVILHQLLRGNKNLQVQLQEHTDVLLSKFNSMEDAFAWVDDIVKTGAVQERKTTVCVLGNTSAGKSSLIRTLESYCQDKGSKPKSVLTGDPKYKSLIETKVMELVKDLQLEKRTQLRLDIKEYANESKFRLICPSTGDENEEKGRSDSDGDIETNETGTNIQMSFVDFAGHSEYVSCSTLFMKKKGIFLICFDTEKLMQASKPLNECYHPAIGTYLEIVTEKCPTPMFFMIATKMDKCKDVSSGKLNQTFNEILKSAQEHLASISKRSNHLKAPFLYDKVIQTSAADEDQLETTLENLASVLVAVCDHSELMDVRLKTMPRVWKEMIENLRKHLQVKIHQVKEEYQKMLESNERILAEINQIEKEYSASAQPILLRSDDLSKWAKMMEEYISSGKDSKAADASDVATFSDSYSKEDALLSPCSPPASSAETHLEEKKSNSTDDAQRQDGLKPFFGRRLLLDSKVKTILHSFSADQDIFWFRLLVYQMNIIGSKFFSVEI